MRSHEEILKRVPYIKPLYPGTFGTEMKIGPKSIIGSVVWSPNEAGWEHVSFSPYDHSKTPSWDDMCYLKDVFFDEEEEVIQIHPKRSEYVNIMQNCLHLWRHPDMRLPDSRSSK